MGHIELARWAQMVLIAPASADFIARLAGGRADDLLATLCLATEAPIALAPAMNRIMWASKATQTNVDTLISRGIRILGPGAGSQACGEVGAGRMWEPVQLAESLLAPPVNAGLLAGLNVLITAGPTRERLDPVRYLTNRSSGKMGYAVARRGARGRRARHPGVGAGAFADPGGRDAHQRGKRARHVRRRPPPDRRCGRIHRGGRRGGFSAGDRRQTEDQEAGVSVKLDLEPAPDIVKSVADMAKRPLRGRLRGRDQRCRGQRAQQAQAQEARHDRRQPGRRKHRLRLRRQCADRDLARRQGGGRTRSEDRGRAQPSLRSSPIACRRPTAAPGADRASAGPWRPRRATGCVPAARGASPKCSTRYACGYWIRASAANTRCRSTQRPARPAWICAPASTPPSGSLRAPPN